MRILHIDMGRELRGGQRQALLLMQVLRDSGHESHLLARPGSELWKHSSDGGFTTRPASLLSIWRHSASFDLVHAHDARSHTISALAARVPLVVSRRVSFPLSSSLASRWKYRRPVRFLAVSQFVANQLKAASIPADKIDIVYDAIKASVPAANWSPQRPVVALASSDPMKGHDLIEQASRIARLPVVFSGNLANDLSHASLFLYISRSEGFGSAALLAMNMGVPVIASRIEGLTEVLEDGISGLAVDNEPSAIAAAMQRVLQQPEFAQLLIANARRRVTEKFTTAHLLSNTLASYRRALGH